MANILIPLYLFLGVIFALLVLMIWLRDNLDTENLDGEDGCLVVILSIIVFVVLSIFWLPVLISLRLSKYYASESDEEAEDESDES